jgi:hypothetical protein
MRSLFSAAALLLLFSATSRAQDPLPARTLVLPEAIVLGSQPESFDLVDFRADQALHPRPPVGEIEPHTIFGIKRHVGIGAGYDNSVFHWTLGLYVTVAEWGRWNFGVPSPAVGFGRYQVYDVETGRGSAKEESSIYVSLASVHYRAGRIESLGGLNWYVNIEQVFDMRRNMAGSQLGLSFSRK